MRQSDAAAEEERTLRLLRMFEVVESHLKAVRGKSRETRDAFLLISAGASRQAILETGITAAALDEAVETARHVFADLKG